MDVCMCGMGLLPFVYYKQRILCNNLFRALKQETKKNVSSEVFFTQTLDSTCVN